VFFLDASVPDLWLHVAPRGTGSLKEVEPLEVMLIEACQRAGLIVVFVAHDGDRFGDKCHLRMFKSYADCERCESLEAVVDYLESLPKNAFVCFPLPDPLHVFKNDRQRIRNHLLALPLDVPPFDASTFSELLPPQVVSVPGQAGSMSDHLALQVCAPEVLAAVLEREDCPSTAPVFLAPISLIATALGCATMTRSRAPGRALGGIRDIPPNLQGHQRT
jgi:hypothetical protein